MAVAAEELTDLQLQEDLEELAAEETLELTLLPQDNLDHQTQAAEAALEDGVFQAMQETVALELLLLDINSNSRH